jgi:acrylyl-CoA reductase (NADPH)
MLAERQGGSVLRSVQVLEEDELGSDAVTVEVDWSSVNYKDALAVTARGGVARLDRLVPGIDLAGRVVESHDPVFAAGDEVLAHCYGIGVSHHGGFAELARLPSEWVVPLPAGLSTKEAMSLGTAGYTAALATVTLESSGVLPGSGPVLVTGASGGVGSVAISLLAARGHEVVASTGKAESADWLRSLGAVEVLDRNEISAVSPKPLERERWAGAVDNVGGDTLASVLRGTRYGGAVAAIGMTGGAALSTTVLPFILRGVSLLGIDAVQSPIEERRALWARLAADLRPPVLASSDQRQIGLDGLDSVLDEIHAGEVTGRVLVQPHR